MTFSWNYMDLFIIVVSIGLSTRFNQIYTRLSTMDGTIYPEIVWREIRMHYTQLCELLEVVNENLSLIVLLSCANNLYFICVQLLNIFK